MKAFISNKDADILEKGQEIENLKDELKKAEDKVKVN